MGFFMDVKSMGGGGKNYPLPPCLKSLKVIEIFSKLKFGTNVRYYLKFMNLEKKCQNYLTIADVSTFLTEFGRFSGKKYCSVNIL